MNKAKSIGFAWFAFFAARRVRKYGFHASCNEQCIACAAWADHYVSERNGDL